MKNRTWLILTVSCLLSVNANAGTNVAISEFVNSIRGSFNMVVADKNVVSSKPLPKTSKMIEKGYRSEVLNMQILLEQAGLDANIRMFNEKRYPQYSDQELNSKQYLHNMILTLSKEAKRRLAGVAFADDSEALTGDDIGTNIDFDDRMLDVSLDTVAVEERGYVSLEQIAQDTLLSVGQEYVQLPSFRGREVLWYASDAEEKIKLGSGTSNLKQVFIPYYGKGIMKPMPLHSVFATTFMPDRNGVLYVMEMYVILVVNEAEHNTARVAQRKIGQFRWDRNPYYISAATGTVLKKIFASTMGQKVGTF